MESVAVSWPEPRVSGDGLSGTSSFSQAVKPVSIRSSKRKGSILITLQHEIGGGTNLLTINKLRDAMQCLISLRS